MMLQVNQVKKKYDNLTVLDSSSLTFNNAEIHGLLGVNGAGKSTLIKIIMGLVFPDSGTISRSETFSLLPENPYLPENLTAFQVVSYACRAQKNIKTVQELLERVLLKKESWDKPIKTYSKGMKQRVSIAYALAGKPEWLILDEPMSGLDAIGRKQMLGVFENCHKEGISLLMCSHSVTDLVRLCDKVHIMSKGDIRQSVVVKHHSMEEVEYLEDRLNFWSSDHVMD